jgi:hypothetical protein
MSMVKLDGLTRDQVLAHVANSKVTRVAFGGQEYADKVQGAMACLAKADKPAAKLYCKVSEKGALSVYGLQRMPVTLYAEQWDRLAKFMPELLEFRKANADKLSTKADKAEKASTAA